MPHVPFYLDYFGSFLDKYSVFLKKAGRWESKYLQYDICNIEVKKPLYITGLARAGSTILLETLNDHPDMVSFQYRDYPFIHFAAFWDIIRKPIPPVKKKIERGHRDRIMINNQSPEALEEILWMSFFDHLHDVKQSNILTDSANNKDFESFYDESIRKLLFFRKARRYLCKNNANIGRLKYIYSLYPDAKFIIPIRRPEEHVFSLIKQHRLITAEQEASPRALRYMQRHGHHEFGQDFRPLNFDDNETTADILADWEIGDLIHAYSTYWAETYGYLHKTLQANPALRSSCMIIRYDDLCAAPESTLAALLDFCDLDEGAQDIIKAWSDKISPPTYYKNDFTNEEKKHLDELTKDTASLYWPRIKA